MPAPAFTFTQPLSQHLEQRECSAAPSQPPSSLTGIPVRLLPHLNTAEQLPGGAEQPFLPRMVLVSPRADFGQGHISPAPGRRWPRGTGKPRDITQQQGMNSSPAIPSQIYSRRMPLAFVLWSPPQWHRRAKGMMSFPS